MLSLVLSTLQNNNNGVIVAADFNINLLQIIERHIMLNTVICSQITVFTSKSHFPPDYQTIM